MLTSDQQAQDANGPTRALRELTYRYVEREPVGMAISALILTMGVFGGLVSMQLEPPVLIFISLTLLAVLVFVFSPRVRQVAFAPAGIGALLFLLVSQGIVAILHTILG